MSDQRLQGLSGEYLVAADLCKQGYAAHLSFGQQAYDILVEANSRLLRLQVKTTAKLHQRKEGNAAASYLFRMAGSNHERIKPTDVDIVALVALDCGAIAYLRASEATARSIRLKPPGSVPHGRSKKAYNIDELPFSKLLQEMTL